MRTIILHKLLLFLISIVPIISSCSKTNSKPTKSVIMVSTLAGTGSPGAVNGIGLSAGFSSPSTLAMGRNGELFVGDFGNNLIRSIDLSNITVSTFSGTGMAGLLNGTNSSSEYRGPANIA